MNSLYSPSASWSIFREIEVILLIKYPIEIAAIKRPSLLDERPYDSDRRVKKEAECSGKIINCTRENAFSHFSFPTLLLSLSLISPSMSTSYDVIFSTPSSLQSCQVCWASAKLSINMLCTCVSFCSPLSQSFFPNWFRNLLLIFCLFAKIKRSAQLCSVRAEQNFFYYSRAFVERGTFTRWSLKSSLLLFLKKRRRKDNLCLQRQIWNRQQWGEYIH